MSWLSYCYKTYQNSVSEIGKQQPGKVPLLPVAHTTQQVNIEVELDKDGNFQYAGLLAQDQRTTIIPCTEESSARTSGMVPHPLVDKLYISLCPPGCVYSPALPRKRMPDRRPGQGKYFVYR